MTTDKHFQMMIYLMLVFFVVDMGLEMLVAIKVPIRPEAITTAHDAFMSFFGVAIGMFRGMLPDSPPSPKP